MNSKSFKPSAVRRLPGLALATAFAAFALRPAVAADAPAALPPAATRPAAPAVALPGLEQLNRECVALYRGLDGCVLRVQLPTPNWVAVAAARDNPLNRYNLNDQVKQAIEQPPRQQRGATSQPAAEPQSRPGEPQRPRGYEQPGGRGRAGQNEQQQQQPVTPQPAQQPAQQPQAGRGGAGQNYDNNNVTANGWNGQNTAPVAVQNGAYTLIVPPPNADVQQLIGNAAVGNNWAATAADADPSFVPNNLGLVLDDRGHVLVPIYIEKEAVGERPVKLARNDGSPLLARFVGSDQQTGLTLLRLTTPSTAARPAATRPAATAPTTRPATAPAIPFAAAFEPAPASVRPAALAHDRLADGALVLMLNPADGAGRLTVWNGGARDFGIVVTIDGRVAGIARYGQFLPANACRLIADQIVRHGVVRRATLGVIITQVEPTDPARAQQPDLGDRPAVRVDQVMKGSAAERAGIRAGDLILSLAGEPVHDIPTLSAAVAARTGPTEVRIVRDGAARTVSVNLVQQ